MKEVESRHPPGAVALIAALRRRRMDEHVMVTAVDISPEALDLARENAAGHGVADRKAA